MLNNKVEEPLGKISSVVSAVYAPQKEWAYSHHPSITFFKDRFYAVWSNGMENEDDLGQRILIAESLDGQIWENIRPLVTPQMFGDCEKVVTATGFHIFEDTLVAYYSVYNYTEKALGGKKTRPRSDDCSHENSDWGYVLTTDGKNWSEPKSLGIGIMVNHGPFKTKSGRIIVAGHLTYPYTDDPRGISGYHRTGIYGHALDNTGDEDDSIILDIAKFNGWDTRLLCEGSVYETDDGVLHMLLRSGSFCLWETKSFDNGETWSEPKPTEFIDDGSKFHAGRLNDGRFYLVNNPVPWSHRIPLCIYLSEDGENFDKGYILRDEPYEMRIEGFGKDGVYGYPHTFIKDEFMYIIYSKHKENIEVTKIKISDL